jgi:hypothetical protein
MQKAYGDVVAKIPAMLEKRRADRRSWWKFW